ncbi:MAG: aminotransferase class I/II-fold pyridoxal phosphate-dependent enzyme [Cuniculiplasma sp.]
MSKNEEHVINDRIDPPGFSLTFPIYQTGSYAFPQGERYRYSREANPTVEELERQINIMEKTERTVCFSSGMGAITTSLLSLLKPGDNVLTTLDTFARSSRFIKDFLSIWGVNSKISTPGTDALLENIDRKYLVFIETISNPSLRVYDIRRIAEKVHSYDGILICDSTFATPENMNPSDLGADIVIHSLSKFISGHNDIIAGSASGHLESMERIDLTRRTMGTNLDPNTAFLVIRGLKTLQLRMREINKNGISVARNLSSLEGIKRVNYPGLEGHPDFEYSRDNLKGYGGVLTFDLMKPSGDPYEIFKRLKKVKAANTLGSVNTILAHPKTMSHRSLSDGELRVLGIGPETYRLSVGIEDAEIIVDDIREALEKM